MTLTLDLTPAIELKKRLTSGAFCSGLMIYLEGITALALLTEGGLAPLLLVPIAIVMAVQVRLVRRPARLMVNGRLEQAYSLSLLLALVFIVLAAAGSRAGDQRAAAALLAAIVIAGTGWPVIAAIRAARDVRAQLRGVTDPSILLACLSFDIGSAIAARVRSFGGDRRRWPAPFLAALAAIIVTMILLGLLQQALGLRLGAVIGQASGLAALFVFRRGLPGHRAITGSRCGCSDALRLPALHRQQQSRRSRARILRSR